MIAERSSLSIGEIVLRGPQGRSVGVPLAATCLGEFDADFLELAYASLGVTLPGLPISFLVIRKSVCSVVNQLLGRLGW